MAGAGGDQGAPGPELPGAAGAATVAGLEARVAALKGALAGEAAELAAAQRRVADLASSVAHKRGEVAAAERQLAWQRVRLDPAWRDWAGLPEHVLVKVAGKHVAQNGAAWAAYYKGVLGWGEKELQELLAKRKQDGNCLFVFALVCKEWRKAQLKVGGPLRTRVHSDVILPGSVELVKWALAEGCPRENEEGFTMALAAAAHGHEKLVRWLIQEQGYAMDVTVMMMAARGGNVELVRWLRGEGCDWDAWTCRFAAYCGHLEVLQWLRANGCPWNWHTCDMAVDQGRVEVLRWARENGCQWDANTRDRAAAELGYTDDFGNLV